MFCEVFDAFPEHLGDKKPLPPLPNPADLGHLQKAMPVAQDAPQDERRPPPERGFDAFLHIDLLANSVD